MLHQGNKPESNSTKQYSRELILLGLRLLGWIYTEKCRKRELKIVFRFCTFLKLLSN